VKIDLKKEISLPKPRKPSLPSAPKLSRKGGGEKPSRRSMGGPELHAPKFLTDLYADLRDRRLLPLVVLLVAAMIAAPILLPGVGSHEEEEAAPVVSVSGGESEASDATLTVVPAESGLRDYKKRLAHRAPLNPFRHAPGESASSHKEGEGSKPEGGSSPSGPEGENESGPSESPTVTFHEETVTKTVGGVTTEVPASVAEPGPVEQPHKPHHKSNNSEAGESGSEAATGPTESAESKPPAAPVETTEPTTPAAPTKPAEPTHTESTPTESAEASPKESSTTHTASEPAASESAPQPIVGYTIDAEAGFVPHTTEKTELAPMTKLPNAKHPLVLFMGLSKDHKRALFLMTSNVTAYYGGHCALDKSSCQLVEVQAGKGVTFADGYGESRYKVHLKRIVPIRHFSK
jgi:hypothetical protein